MAWPRSPRPSAKCRKWPLAFPAFTWKGPFISPDDGPRGAHPRQHVRPPDWDEFRRLQDAAQGRIKLLDGLARI